MKRRLFQLLSLLIVNFILLSLSSTAVAATIGNPIPILKTGTFGLGLEIDFTKRDIDIDKNDEIEIERKSYLLKGTCGISDQLNIYAKLGMADGKADVELLEKEQFKSDLELSYGVGLKVTFYNKNNLKIGFGMQISSFSAEDNPFKGIYVLSNEEKVYFGFDPLINVELNSIDSEISWMEYDLDLGVSFEMQKNFQLYGGILYSKIDGDNKIIYKGKVAGEGGSMSEKFDIEEIDPFGVFAGGSYDINEQLTIGLEARLITETSFSFKLNYAF